MTTVESNSRMELLSLLTLMPVASRTLSDGTRQIISVDRTGSPAVANFLSCAPDGTAEAKRWRTHLMSGSPFEVVDTATDEDEIAAPFSEIADWFGARGKPSGYASHFASAFAVRYPRSEIDTEVARDLGAAQLVAGGAPAVLEALNRDALSALRAISSFPQSAFAFYATPERGLFRRQAAEAYPLLALDFATKPTLKMAIDLKKPLNETIMRAYGEIDTGVPKMSKAVLRRLEKVDWADRGTTPALLAEMLSRIPADWFPKSQSEFEAFMDLVDGPFRVLAPELPDGITSLVEGCGGKWADLRKRTARGAASTLAPDGLSPEEERRWKPTGDESAEGLRASAHGAVEMLRAFRDQVVLPIAASAAGDCDVYLGPESRRMATDAAARLLLSSKALPAVMEAQRDWHVKANDILEATGGAPERMQRGSLKVVAEDGWAPLTDIWVAPNGIQIVPLTDPRELAEEGRRLRHCVGGYNAKAQRGDCHIVSFRLEHEGALRPLSTAEFGRLSADSDRLHTVQHHGPGNGTPCELAKAAFNWFTQEVEARRIPLNRDGIMSYLSGRRRPTDDVHYQAGYDRKDLELVGKVVSAWQPLLGKRLRGLDIEAFRQLPEMTDLVEALAPSFMPASRF
ncbi:PcfJ domain-containing protein [Bosea sp. RAC05]|uniref:PcfJ domain-containing protein n=1 Tax=Bosea sp. RAC05 TaxID=1842539 RepID=UPI00083D70BA|nr:PcfJ domain-containing protein [Bosea sp. RAC05]AOG02963.1 pcfJ-like family protein [Bosea sp. RAC05]